MQTTKIRKTRNFSEKLANIALIGWGVVLATNAIDRIANDWNLHHEIAKLFVANPSPNWCINICLVLWFWAIWASLGYVLISTQKQINQVLS